MKHHIKKLVCLISMILLVLCCLFAFAMAEEDEGELITMDISPYLIQHGGSPSAFRARGTWPAEAEQLVYDALVNMKTSISLSTYKMSQDLFCKMYFDICNNHGELFYVGTSVSWSYSGGYVTKVYPEYTEYGEPLETVKQRFDNAVNKAVNHAKKGATPLLRVLMANDYLCDHMTYDFTYTKYDAYSALVLGTAVCQGYMEAYDVILDKLGVTSTYALSDAMNHIWNVVKLDGKWYHVDVTWNDGSDGGSYHRYFLRSDGALELHYSWESAVTASSTKYDNYFWSNFGNTIPVSGDSVYYVESNGTNRTLKRWSSTTEALTALCTFDAVWYIGTDATPDWGSYRSGYYGAVGVIGDRVYYVVPDGVMSVPVEGGTPRREMKIPASSGSIWSSAFTGSTLTYKLGTDYNELTGTYTWDSGVHLHDPMDQDEIPPTCTEPGTAAGIVCSTCGEVIEGCEEIPAAGHTEVIMPEVPVMCTEPGFTEWSYCSVCMEVLVSWEDIPALGCHHTVDGECVICGETFTTAGLKTITLPEGMTRLGKRGLSNVVAEAIVIPYSCTAVGSEAFSKNPGLKYLFLPAFYEDEGVLPADALDGSDPMIVYYE